VWRALQPGLRARASLSLHTIWRWQPFFSCDREQIFEYVVYDALELWVVARFPGVSWLHKDKGREDKQGQAAIVPSRAALLAIRCASVGACCRRVGVSLWVGASVCVGGYVAHRAGCLVFAVMLF
jgi:hypothetical protein